MEVKAAARTAKAKKYGLPEREVMLTPAEVDEAKRVARDSKKLRLQSKLFEDSKASNTTNNSVPVRKFPGTFPSQEWRAIIGLKLEPEDPPQYTAHGGQKTGSRATALTKVKTARRDCKQADPSLVDDARFLHLVQYVNCWSRLRSQWETFKTQFASQGLKSPMRGLLPATDERVQDCLSTISYLLEQQADSNKTYILQDTETGASYWSGGMPSAACPPELRDRLPPDVLLAFANMRNQWDAVE
jgi:hypothetical protein